MAMPSQPRERGTPAYPEGSRRCKSIVLVVSPALSSAYTSSSQRYRPANCSKGHRVLRCYTDQDIPRAFCSNPVEAMSSQHFKVEVLEVSWGHSSDLSPDKAQALKVSTLAQGWNRTSSSGYQGSRSPT